MRPVATRSRTWRLGPAALGPCTVALALLACRRETGTRLQQQALFPDTIQAVAVAPPSSPVRAELVTEAEPNDGPAQAQPVAAFAVVEGTLGTAALIAGPPRGRGKGHGPILDVDWYRIPAVPPGHGVQFDLRAAPGCAEIALYDATGQVLVARAHAWKGTRPVLAAIGPGAQASLVRVACPVKGPAYGKGAPGGSPYRLAVTTRPLLADEEVEPNDRPAAELQALTLGSVRQATLAPVGDKDHVPLDLTQALAGEAVVLSVAGVPDLELQVELLDPVTLEPILRRKSARGAPVLVPNLDAARTGPHPWLVVRAVAGQAPDAPYAVTVSPWLPSGCASQAACAERLPVEREPNDAPTQAFVVPATGVSGLVDAPGDVDWFRWQPAAAGEVASLRVQAPPGLGLVLQIGNGKSAWKLPIAAGMAVTLGGLAPEAQAPSPLAPSGEAALILAVRGAGTAASQTEAYRLDVTPLAMAGFEVELGDEARSPALWAPQHRIEAGEFGARQRCGALLPAGDHDAFGLDLRDREQPTGWRFSCHGDGQPGLACTVVDVHGSERVRLASGTGDDPAEALLVLAPGRYKVLVAADAPRPSLQPYVVSFQEDALALALPGADTPTALAEPATALGEPETAR